MGLFKKKRKEFERKIIVEENSIRRETYGYTRLRDNVLYINADGNHKVIQFASSCAAEGKTTVICNLAVSLGYTEKKVLVIDIDFRRPRVNRLFNLSKDKGIAEYLLGSLTKDQIIKKTEYKNVDIITRGAQIDNPSLVLVSEKFKKLINELREEYDYILFDCAPILQVSDYIHVSSLSDGVIFLVAFASTTKSQVAEAVAELNKNNIPILGTVFTMYDRKKDGNAYYSYYNYPDEE